MSKVTTMTTKGQVTIPKDVRDALGLKPFDKIEIVTDGEGGARLRKARLSLEEVVGIFPAAGIPDDQLEQATNEALAEHYIRPPR